MEWRIRKDSIGRWVAEKGVEIKEGPNPFGPGYIMPGFMVYELHTFKTEKDAKKYIDKKEGNKYV